MPKTKLQEELVEEIKERVEHKIMEPENGKLLVKLIEQAESDNEAMQIAQLGTMYMRTGLHYSPRLENAGDDIWYLKKQGEGSLTKSFDNGGTKNKLILGDNYPALQNLLVQYRGQVDVIYIDPPYGCDSMGQFAKVNYRNRITRDNLLSMLEPRLRLAKDLLSEEGVIFVSMDYKNEAYVKCLMDDIFMEKNYYGEFIQEKGNTQNDSKTIQNNHEYILCYAKNNKPMLLTYESSTKSPVYEDIFADTKCYSDGRDTGASSGHDRLADRANLGYTTYYIEQTISGATGNHNRLADRAEEFNKKYGSYKWYLSKDGKTFIHAIAVHDYDESEVRPGRVMSDVYTDCKDLISAGYTAIRPPERKGGELGCWTWGQETFQDYWNHNEVVIKNHRNVIKKQFVRMDQIVIEKGKKYVVHTNRLPLQSIIKIGNAQGTSIFSGKNGIIPGCPFSNPKNPNMIKHLLQAYGNKNALVLDFFAGSGTTGQAVLDLNREDGGNRTFILCTDEDKGGYVECPENDPRKLFSKNEKWFRRAYPHGIGTDVTYERLFRVMNGRGTKEETVPWTLKNEPYGQSLAVYRLEPVADFNREDGQSAFDVIDEKDYGLNFHGDAKKKIEWVSTHFQKTRKTIEDDPDYIKRLEREEA